MRIKNLEHQREGLHRYSTCRGAIPTVPRWRDTLPIERFGYAAHFRPMLWLASAPWLLGGRATLHVNRDSIKAPSAPNRIVSGRRLIGANLSGVRTSTGAGSHRPQNTRPAPTQCWSGSEGNSRFVVVGSAHRANPGSHPDGGQALRLSLPYCAF
uniref:Uncharacterized protein n=1 Tax=Ralstonia solanacearum TaxID=305 RepID=A0A0S4UY28_RALSL|nr:protein of unknown function [Ralstonia solanacearum]